MTLLAAHGIVLLFFLGLTAHKLFSNPVDRVLSTVVMAWTNIVFVAILLSVMHLLGNPLLFFRVSVGGALLTYVLVQFFSRPKSDLLQKPSVEREINWLPILAFLATILPLAVGSLVIARAYVPNNYDSLTYHLPRVLFYLGQGSLEHFDTENARQVFFPFNLSLLYLSILQHGIAFEKLLTLIHVGFWLLTGVAIYRVCRLAERSVSASLAATWLGMTATQILAQATATTNDLPTGALLLFAVVFIQRWASRHQFRDALLGSASLGLAFGAKLTPAFLVPGLALLLGYVIYRFRASVTPREFGRQARIWAVPLIVFLVLTIPFVVYNWMASGHLMTEAFDYSLNKPFKFGVFWQTAKVYTLQFFLEPLQRFTFDLSLTAALNHIAEKFLIQGWNPAYAFSPLYFFPPDLNEDHVWFGFSGGFVILSALACLRKDRSRLTLLSSLAMLGLSWLVIYFALNKWSLYIQRYFVVPFLLMVPCTALYFDRSRNWRVPRSMARVAVVALFMTSFWFSLSYLFQNTIRPLTPILFKSETKPAELQIPNELFSALAKHSDINMSLAGGNERTFPLMRASPSAHFTSKSSLDEDKYNVISKWGFTKNAVYFNIAGKESHMLLSVPGKRTAGIERLGSTGEDVNEFEYFGLESHPGRQAASIENDNILIDLKYERSGDTRFMNAQMSLLGLNREDGLEATLYAEYPANGQVLLAKVVNSSQVTLPIKSSIRQLVLEFREQGEKFLVAQARLPFNVLQKKEDLAGDDPSALFNINFISNSEVANNSIGGLRSLEGPYPQWGLPSFRWAIQPSVRIVTASQDGLAKIQLIFSARLQVRENAELELLLNGKVLKAYNLRGRANWLDDSVTLAAAPGENVIELRDTLVDKRPDWDEYLTQNPDALSWVKRQALPTLSGAEQHYDRIGRSEGLDLHFKKMSDQKNLPPDSLFFVFRTLQVVGLKEGEQQ